MYYFVGGGFVVLSLFLTIFAQVEVFAHQTVSVVDEMTLSMEQQMACALDGRLLAACSSHNSMQDLTDLYDEYIVFLEDVELELQEIHKNIG
ncbi:MAG: hypothetical protein ACMXYC_00460 [Candidatus Woesearchaeota archaeon]